MKLNYLYSIPFLLFIGCTPTGETPENDILPPEAVNLIFPEDNTECNTGVEVNEAQSSVNFEWEASENTDSYEVFVSDLNSESIIQIDSETNDVIITINKATAYEWYVLSKSNSTEETAKSDTWRFYNAGDAAINHAPFPADLGSPALGSTLSDIGSVVLEWIGNDIDNDIVEFEIFFGTENPPTTTLGTSINSNLTAEVVSGETYYWIVKTFDSASNSSESDVFWFRVD